MTNLRFEKAGSRWDPNLVIESRDEGPRLCNILHQIPCPCPRLAPKMDETWRMGIRDIEDVWYFPKLRSFSHQSLILFDCGTNTFDISESVPYFFSICSISYPRKIHSSRFQISSQTRFLFAANNHLPSLFIRFHCWLYITRGELLFMDT